MSFISFIFFLFFFVESILRFVSMTRVLCYCLIEWKVIINIIAIIANGLDYKSMDDV